MTLPAIPKIVQNLNMVKKSGGKKHLDQSLNYV